MVVPIIAGAALLSFITFGEKFLGKKTFKKVLTALILLGIGIVGYIIYKMYKAWEKAKETAEDTVEDIKDVMEGGWEWVLAGQKDVYKWAEEGALARERAVEKLDPYLGIKSGISETSLEAKQYAAGQKVREDILNAPQYYWNKLWGK